MGPLFAALQTLLAAQATLATITGTVRDAETSAPLAGALVLLEDLSRVAVADSTGHYELGQLPGGAFRLTVRFRGYTERSLQALVPSGGHLQVDMVLQAETHQLPPLEVTAEPGMPALARADRWPSPDRTIQTTDIRKDPMLAEPDVLAALHGGTVTIEPESPDGVHVRGGASDQTAYLLDGIPVLSAYHAAGVFSAWNPDLLSGVSLATPAWSGMEADAVSGAVEGRTRVPGGQVGSQGSIGTGQARVALDGPLGRSGAGFLLGFRSRMPNVVAPADPTYLNGAARDWLAKVEIPMLGGRLHLLAYDNHNSFEAAGAVTSADTTDPAVLRNRFAWNGHSLGAEWMRVARRTTVNLRAWNATAASTALWAAGPGALGLDASRRDYGISASAELRSARSATTIGARLVHGSSTYEVSGGATPAGQWQLAGSAPVGTVYVRQVRAIGSAFRLDLGLTWSMLRHANYPAPRASLAWSPSSRLTVSGSVGRAWQFTQSLRNAESVVGGIFPAELYVNAAAPGVPVLRSDLGVLAVTYRASSTTRLSVEGFARADEGLLLVAPVTGEPFASGAFVIGASRMRGGALDVGWSKGQVAATASYALQAVHYSYAGGQYVPGHGVAHQLELGVSWNPSPSWSLRVGALGAANRRATEVSGGFEWEACNLVDRGCEFGGSPTSNSPGTTRLPAYFRVDLGVRKQWQVRMGGRSGVMALFGTVSNLFGRSNVLTFSTDPVTRERNAVEMRPRAPLVVGVEWGF